VPTTKGGKNCAIKGRPAVVAGPATEAPADLVREEDLNVVRTENVLSAAFAALVFTGRGSAQQAAPVTAVTLDEALRRSQMVAPSVVAAQGSIRSAQLSTRSAQWAFLPALTVSPRADLQLSCCSSRLDPVTQQIIEGSTSAPSLSFGANASYTIFDGFARNAVLRQRHAQELGADASLTTAKFANDLATTTAFFNALGQQQLVAVEEKNVEAADVQLRLAAAKLHAGSGQLSDSLTAVGSFLSARLRLLNAQNALVVNETNLGRLVGVAGRVSAVNDSAFYRVTFALDTASIRQEIMVSSPAIKSLEASLIAAQEAWRASKAGYLPTLAVSAGQSWTASKPDYNFVPRRNLGVTLSINPWTSMQRETQIENNAIQITNTEASLADTRNALAAQINQSYASLATAQETLNVTDAAVRAGEENLRVVTERYRIGVATITEVVNAQQQLVSAQSSQVTARYSYLLAKAQLAQILGRKL